jgi:hypothetical protein
MKKNNKGKQVGRFVVEWMHGWTEQEVLDTQA